MTTRSPEIWRPLYPFDSHELDIDGLRYHYLDEGQGKPLLLVHGNPTWSFYWRSLVEAFRGDYRVIVPDHIGCGLSQKPKPGEYPFTLARRIEDLKRLIEHLNLKDATLIAHDWGGAIGMGAAVDLPQRFARFVLMNTAAFRANRMPWRIRAGRIPVLGRVGIQGLNLFSRMALRMAMEHPERLTPAAAAGLLAPYDSWAHREAVYRFVQDIPVRPSHPSYATLQHIEQGLAQFVERPVCLVWGMKDWCFSPWFLERFVEFFPHATVHPLHDAGHYLIEDAPDQVISHILDFLEGTGP